MANMNLKVTIAATGVPQQISKSLPANNGVGNSVFDPGSVYVQQLLFQNQGSNNMWVGDRSTTTTNGLLIVPSAGANFGAFINYGSYLGDWWVAGTAGDVLFALYIK